MNLPEAIGLVLLVSLAIVTYRATTLAIWCGHWLPHRPGSRLREFHMDGHHTLYADSAHARSAFFVFARGRHSSLVPLAPGVLALAGAQWLVYPAPLALACTLEIAAVVAALTYAHNCFHVDGCWLARFRWFRRARAIHDLHHDADVNFMVVDHFWDRVFGTFRDAGEGVGS
jgi:sterol desaturase/sphingolipid hydroxylase (fatty acid hydroxylase superfamily)